MDFGGFALLNVFEVSASCFRDKKTEMQFKPFVMHCGKHRRETASKQYVI